MAKYAIDGDTLSAIANSIRAKTETTSSIPVNRMAAEIENISCASEPNLQEKTVSPTTYKQTVLPDDGYDGLSSVQVEAMERVGLAKPKVSFDYQSGLITAKMQQPVSGYVESFYTSEATMQLDTRDEQTITPGTSDQTIPEGTYLAGTQTIKGDANLKAENIKNGVSIFGVQGSCEGSDSSETCTLEVYYDGYDDDSKITMRHQWSACEHYDNSGRGRYWQSYPYITDNNWKRTYGNALCGGQYIVYANYYGYDGFEADGAELLAFVADGCAKIFRITAPPGGKATIRLLNTKHQFT